MEVKSRKTSKPFVSIIVPVYNAEAYIKQTIESALDQTWRSKEIIIVNDGSQDNSLDVVLQFKDKENVRIFSQVNAGSCAARNFGFEQSIGDYIQYLDADDLLSPDKIEEQVKLLQHLPKDYVASCSWGKFRNVKGEAIFKFQKIWKDFSPIEWLVTAWNGGGMMQTACWLVPRRLIEKAGGWNNKLKSNPNDDGEFFCRVLLQCSGIKFSNFGKVYYRLHEGERVSNGRNKDAITSLFMTIISYEENILKHEKSSRTINALATNYASFIYQYHDTFPDLAHRAKMKLDALDATKIVLPGGPIFKLLSIFFGFENSIILRSYSRRFQFKLAKYLK